MRTWFGTYQFTFLAGGLLCLIAAGLVVRIGRGTPAPVAARPALNVGSAGAD
jgi:hypothetical protein